MIIAGEAGSIFEDFIRSGKVDQLADPSQIAGLKAVAGCAGGGLSARHARADAGAGGVPRRCFWMWTCCSRRPVWTPRRTRPSRWIGRAPGPTPSSRGLSGLIPAGNLAGLPALSLPCGFADGLPIGISLVARPFYEHQILAAGAAFQSQTDWHRRKPPVGD